jgi:hypothetical protein
MTRPIVRDPIYRKRMFDAGIITLCVRRYISYKLSYRDLVEIMAERGIDVAHSTILRWVTRFVPEFEKRWDRYRRRVGGSWRVDESVPQQAAEEMREGGAGCPASRNRLAGADCKPPQAAGVKSPGRERCGKGALRHQVRIEEGEQQ